MKITMKINDLKNEINVNWGDYIERNDKGKVINKIENYINYLNNSPKYKNQIKYNEFLQQKEIFNREFNDFDLNILYNDFDRDLELSTRSKIDSALMETFEKNKYNPIIDYLNNIQWDGKKRIENLFIDLLEADNNELNRYMTKIWFIAAVKRVLQPGCKFDNMIVLQGEQGIGKSSICELISKGFFNNISLNEIGNKDIVDKLNKTWICCIDELDSFNKKEMSNIKTFISQTKDSVRLAYGKMTNSYLRHCIFIGSTNDSTFLRDNSSLVERRFWVIKCNKKNRDSNIYDTLDEIYINQLWAEAVYYYNENPDLYLDISYDLQDIFAKTMKNFKTFNEDSISDYLNEILNKNYSTNTNGEFRDINDFYSQCVSNNIYEEDYRNKINKIPFSYIKYVLKKMYNEERSAKYISMCLNDEWEYKVIKYNEKSYKGYYRKVTELPKN